jgi:hypothetical protein
MSTGPVGIPGVILVHPPTRGRPTTRGREADLIVAKNVGTARRGRSTVWLAASSWRAQRRGAAHHLGHAHSPGITFTVVPASGVGAAPATRHDFVVAVGA